MTKDLAIDTVLSLQEELESAIENRETAIMVHDWNMVKAWDEQLEFIVERIKKLGIEV